MSDPRIYVVDDDDAIRAGLRALLETNGHTVEDFDSAEAFLENHSPDRSGCLLVDIRMPGLSGLELQAKLAVEKSHLSVIVVSGHGDIPAAIKAMGAGAVDFIEKPYAAETVLAAIERGLDINQRVAQEAAQAEDIKLRLERLTKREYEVMEQLVAGVSNKVVARALDISPRTVEIHRARIFDKMQCQNLAELIRVTLTAGILPQ